MGKIKKTDAYAKANEPFKVNRKCSLYNLKVTVFDPQLSPTQRMSNIDWVN